MSSSVEATEVLKHARKRFSQSEIAKICDKDVDLHPILTRL